MTAWSAFPLAIARAAGFDYELLDRLADPNLLTAAPDDLAEHYARSCAGARAALAELLTDPAVREGVAVLAPDTLRFTAEQVRRRRDRPGAPDKHERKMALFLQRLTAKCDTNAIAGTVGYVPLTDDLTRHVPDHPDRRGFVAHWVASELVLREATAGGRFRQRHPELGPAVGLLPPRAAERVRTLVRGAADWDSASRDARTGARGHRTDEQDEQIDEQVVASLHRRGVVWSAPVLPVAEPDALRSVRTVAPDLDLTPLTTAADAYAQGDAERKCSALSSAEQWVAHQGISQVRRGAGEVYADRTVLYAEHYDPASGRRWPQEHHDPILEALDPVLDLAAATGVWGREQAVRCATADLARLAGARNRVCLSEVLREMPSGYPVDLTGAEPLAVLLSQVRQRRRDRAPVSLTAAEVSEAAAPWLRDREQVLVASPDIFLLPDGAGPPGVVVGEVHAGLTVFGNLLCFLTDQDAVIAKARGWLSDQDPGAARLVNVAMGQRFGKVCHLEVMPRTLEVTGRRATGRLPVGVADVEVGRDLVARLRRTGERVELLLAAGDGSVFSPLAPPAARLPTLRIPGAEFMPRLTVGTVVLQRASWWFPLEQMRSLGTGGGAERYRRVTDFARRAGLPRRTFVRIPGEPKPVHLDLASPLLVDAVARLLARQGPPAGAPDAVRMGGIRTSEASDAAEVRFSEMLPEPAPGAPMQEYRLSCVRRRR